MARTPYSLNSYTGEAGAAYVAGSGWGAADTTITITGTTAGWSTLGTTGGWYFTAGLGTASEEKIFVPSGSYSFSSGAVTLTSVVRGVDINGAAYAQPASGICTPVWTATEASEANTLVSLYLGNAVVRSASAVVSPGERTLASGTAALTLTLPSGNLIDQTVNTVANYTTNSVTIASGSTAQMNTFGVLGNNIVYSGQVYEYVYMSGNNTWYAFNSNDITDIYGQGTAGQVLGAPAGLGSSPAWTTTISGATTTIIGNTTAVISGATVNIYGTTNALGTVVASTLNVSGTMTISGGTIPTYAFPPTYFSPYKAWNVDPALATASVTLITGTAYYTAIWIPQPCVISGISFYVSSAVTGNVYAALFSAANNTQVAVCSGLSSPGTGMVKALVSGGTYAVTTPALYYVGLVVSGTTGGGLYGPVASPAAALLNMNVTTPQSNVLTGFRNASVIIGQRALYSNTTTVSGSIATSTLMPWYALS